MKKAAGKFHFFSKVVRWIIDNVPPSPENFSICHGDFHPGNVLMESKRITGVVDWAAFSIADPAQDVAQTYFILTVVIKRLVAETKKKEIADTASIHIEYETMGDRYLTAYLRENRIAEYRINFYKTVSSLIGLVMAQQGIMALSHPAIVKDSIYLIKEITGIEITWVQPLDKKPTASV